MCVCQSYTPIMAVRLGSAPSLHSLALPQRQVPFVLPRRHSSVDKCRRHSAAEELVSRIPPRSRTMEAILNDSPRNLRLGGEKTTGGGERSCGFSPRPKASPRRCNSDPNSCTFSRHVDVDVLTSSVSTPNSRRHPRRCNSEPNESRVHRLCNAEESLCASLATVHKKQEQSKSFSQACGVTDSSSLHHCSVMRAYQEAVYFHEKLREEYETSKRVFILFRYRRLRSLIREATVEQQMEHLRRAVQCKCSCAAHVSLGDEETADGLTEELTEAMRPAFIKIKAYLQSAINYIAPTLLTSSTPSLHSASSSSSPSSLRVNEHEWQRSRLVLLERHLERLKRECLSSTQSSLPHARYKAMKSGLKHVLDARLV